MIKPKFEDIIADFPIDIYSKEGTKRFLKLSSFVQAKNYINFGQNDTYFLPTFWFLTFETGFFKVMVRAIPISFSSS